LLSSQFAGKHLSQIIILHADGNISLVTCLTKKMPLNPPCLHECGNENYLNTFFGDPNGTAVILRIDNP
jgi:hypothetical protein